jgi:hypothetical protein
MDVDFEDINAISYVVTNSFPCNRCVKGFIKCDICNGLFRINFFEAVHWKLCKEIYTYEKEKDELAECPMCNCLVKLTSFNAHIDNCDTSKTVNVDCSICKKPVPMNLLEEHEVMCEKAQSDIMLIKEKLECSFCKQNIPLIDIEQHEKDCQKFIDSQNKIKQELSKETIEYPKEWDISGMNKTDYKLVQVTGEEYWMAKELFNLTSGVKISNVWRVQNLSLWESFYREKLRIKQEKGYIEEKLLFFANKNVKLEHIEKNGFDISFANDNQSYGRGIYFRRRADKVILDAFKRSSKDRFSYIFLSTVLVGIAFESNQNVSLRKPPFYDESKFIYYDSVTNMENFSDLKDADQIFVVYNNEKAYPSYLIEISQ